MNTRIIAHPFTYLEPRTLREALELLREYGEKAKIMAGGTDLLVALKTKGLKVDYVINIMEVPELAFIGMNKDIRIGPTTLHQKIEQDETIHRYAPLLTEAEKRLGSVQVRNMATIGGNLCNASPCADTAVALMAMGAQLRLISSRGERRVSIEDFFKGPGQSILSHDELLAEIEIAPLPFSGGTAFLKIARVYMDLAKVNVGVVLNRSQNTCTGCRIAIGSAAPVPMLASEAGKMMVGERVTSDFIDKVCQKAEKEVSPITDVRSTAEYRRACTKVLVRDAIMIAWERSALSSGDQNFS